MAGIYLAVLVFYFVNSLVWYQRWPDLAEIQSKADLRALDYQMPSLTLLKEAQSQTPDSSSRRRLRQWADYFGRKAAYTPHPADSYAWQGYCYYCLRQPINAVAAYQKAIQINPPYFWFHHNLGVIYFANQEYGQAVRSFSDALQTQPYFTLSTMRAYITVIPTLILGRWPPLSATEHMLRMNEILRQGYVDCYRLSTVSLFRLGNYAAVLEQSLQALQIRETDRNFFYIMAGMAAAQMQEPQQALGLLTQGLADYQQDPVVMRYLGQTLHALGQLEESRKVLLQAEQFERENMPDIFTTLEPSIIIF